MKTRPPSISQLRRILHTIEGLGPMGPWPENWDDGDSAYFEGVKAALAYAVGRESRLQLRIVGAFKEFHRVHHEIRLCNCSACRTWEKMRDAKAEGEGQ